MTNSRNKKRVTAVFQKREKDTWSSRCLLEPESGSTESADTARRALDLDSSCATMPSLSADHRRTYRIEEWARAHRPTKLDAVRACGERVASHVSVSSLRQQAQLRTWPVSVCAVKDIRRLHRTTFSSRMRMLWEFLMLLRFECVSPWCGIIAMSRFSSSLQFEIVNTLPDPVPVG